MPPKVLTWSEPESPTILRQTAAVLARGGVAILPAEGLYGLHVCGAPAPLRALKRESEVRPYIVLIASPDQAREYCGSPPESLADLWPAPLTLLLPATPVVDPALVREGLIALRCPASAFLRDLAAELPGPLLSTSANRAGEPAPASIPDLDPELRAECDLIVDGGPLSGIGSTIARIKPDGLFEIVRAGAWSSRS